MSTKAGTLLWNRRRLTLQAGTTSIDTGLRQVSQSFEASSINEPPLGISGVAAPVNGTPPASRVQVIPMAPISGWTGLSHSEPWFNTTTGTVWVDFVNDTQEPIALVNVLFWDPHTSIGPGQADTYNAPIID